IYNANYGLNIQEEEQKFCSRADIFEENKIKKNSPNLKVETTQGKHPVNYRKKLPLGVTNL
ncbi:hypothetical protein, partial [Flavobacterium sp.]|uniref:hypothetical protein n=1 Tax=Flavobacterium sp. TaxID=239 RepID=UPI0037518BA4